MQLIYIIGGLGVFATVALLGVVLFYVRKMRRERTYRVSMGAGDAADDAVANELQSMIESGHHLPVTLAFRNLTYELPNGSNNRVRILKGVHGVVKPGEVMAILGASGAGKSTCLDILGGKTKRGVVQGEILINGKAPTRRQYKRISGFVDQEDKLMGTLTVYEALLYSAMLRLPKTMSHAAKERRVRETMVDGR